MPAMPRACMMFLCLSFPFAGWSQDAAPESPPVADPVDAGAFLAARVAGMENDFTAAATSFTRALISDPSNLELMEGAIISSIGSGRLDNAVIVASQAPKATRGPTAQIILLADQAKRADFEGLLAETNAGRKTATLIDQLATGWAELGAGRMSEAQATFDKLAETAGIGVFGQFHKALALASVGDFEGADAIFSGPTGASIKTLRRGVIAHAQVLSQLERNPDAVALLDEVFIPGQDAVITALRARLEAGEPVPFEVVRNATDGMAEVFFTLATALNGEADNSQTLIYARIATWLRPDHTEAQLLTAGLLDRLNQPILATEAYAKISPDDPAFVDAERGRAETLSRSDNTEAAIEVLTTLARTYPGMIDVQRQLGDLLRREEKFEAAITVYDAAIALLGPTLDARDWNLFFMRGICHERQKRWELAEQDFRKALELQPDQPQVLNYMGYSMLERRENLEEALSMIERAVAAEPESGYIIDSLAWGYFQLGRYEDAVAPMEKASLLEPLDAVVTDHLGDIYWAVGRKLEARFQWRRALSFEPEEKEANRIRRKLEVGLDAVRAEEGQAPIEAQTAADEI
jgi:Flp pilus assembly protein TadD